MPRRGKNLFKCCATSSTSRSPSPPARSAPQPPRQPPPLPNGFLCPISCSLMAEPVVATPAGHTFDRVYIEACKELNYIPSNLPSSSRADFPSFSFIPNQTLQNIILDWCDHNGYPRPLPTSQEAARGFVQNLMAGGNQEPSLSHQEGGSGHSRISDGPGTARTGKNLSTVKKEDSPPAQIVYAIDPSTAPSEYVKIEWQILKLLQDTDNSAKQSGLISLIKHIMGDDEGMTVVLCNERIMFLVIPLLHSSNEEIQTNATSAIFAFTLESCNGTKIIQWRALPGLVHVLSNGSLLARANAAGAIYNLGLGGEQSCLAIGSSGAILPLFENFSNPLISRVGRIHAGSAIHRLTQWSFNLDILEKTGAAPILMAVATDKSSDVARNLRGCAMKIMCYLAERSKGSEELMDAMVVEEMLRMMREGEGMDEHCLDVMYKICTNYSDRFREIALAAGAKDVLAEEKEQWGEDSKNMARVILRTIGQRDTMGAASSKS